MCADASLSNPSPYYYGSSLCQDQSQMEEAKASIVSILSKSFTASPVAVYLLKLKFYAQRISHQDLVDVVDNIFIVTQCTLFELGFVSELNQLPARYGDFLQVNRAGYSKVALFFWLHPPDSAHTVSSSGKLTCFIICFVKVVHSTQGNFTQQQNTLVLRHRGEAIVRRF